MVTGTGRKVSATADWLAVGGVCCEPVSLFIWEVAGKSTGVGSSEIDPAVSRDRSPPVSGPIRLAWP